LVSQLQQDAADKPFGAPHCGHGARCESAGGGVSVAQSSNAGSGGGNASRVVSSTGVSACAAARPFLNLRTELMARNPSLALTFGVLSDPHP
jgi:hypothetical protein